MSSGSSQGLVCQCPSNDPHYIPPAVKFPDSLMVWGCFTYHGVGSLVVLLKNPSLSQRSYLELLCDHLPGSSVMSHTTTFMQDGALCHTARSVKQWLKDCCMLFFEDWRASSPDLNPIENLWAIIKRELRSHNCPTLPKFQAVLHHLWRSFTPQHLMELLANSLPAHLEV